MIKNRDAESSREKSRRAADQTTDERFAGMFLWQSSRGGSTGTGSGSTPTEHAFVLTYSDGSVAVHRFHPRFAPDGAGDPSHAFHRQTKELLSSMHAEGVAAQR